MSYDYKNNKESAYPSILVTNLTDEIKLLIMTPMLLGWKAWTEAAHKMILAIEKKSFIRFPKTELTPCRKNRKQKPTA